MATQTSAKCNSWYARYSRCHKFQSRQTRLMLLPLHSATYKPNIREFGLACRKLRLDESRTARSLQSAQAG